MSHPSPWPLRRPFAGLLAGSAAFAVVLAGLVVGAAAPASAAAPGPCSYGGGDASISFDGDPAVGAPLTATLVPGTGDIDTGDLDFTWSGTGFGAPVRGRTFTARYDLVGAATHLSVRSRAGGTRFTAECDLERVGWGHIARPAAPEVTGRPVLGGTLHAHSPAGDALPPRAAYHYEWFAGGSTSAFTTGDDVRLGADQVGKTIVVKAMVTALGFRDSSWSAPTETDQVAEGTLEAPGVPHLSGRLAMAGTLQASPADGDDYPADATYDYQWLADGVPFATGEQVTLGAAQVGRTITVRARVGASGYAVSEWSAASTPGGAVSIGDLDTPSAVAVTGTPKVGELLTAVVTGGWTPGASVVFTWKADGVPFATDPGTVRLTTAEQGKTITLQLTGSLAGYADEAVESPAVGPVAVGVALTTPGTPAISGVAQLGKVLTATPAGDNPDWPDDVTFSYEWFADGQSFATGEQVPLGAGQVGRTITVRTQVSAPGYAESEWSAASAPTAPVVGGVLETPSSVRVSGKPRVGETLTATVVGSWTPGTQVVFTWRANGAEFGGGSRKVELTARELGKRITVEVSGSLAGYEPATVTSDRTGKVDEGTLDTAKPKVRGVAKVGRTMTVDPGRWTPGTRLTFQWYAGGRAIQGATGESLGLTKKLKRERITVKVTGHLAGYAAATRTSRATARVQ